MEEICSTSRDRSLRRLLDITLEVAIADTNVYTERRRWNLILSKAGRNEAFFSFQRQNRKSHSAFTAKLSLIQSNYIM